MADTPTIVQKKAIDVTPLNHGIWCRVGGSEPHVNDIVLRRWSEDGNQISFMLESFNFLFADPDELIDVVEIPPMYHDELFRRCLAEDAEWMAKRPAVCDQCGKPLGVS